VEIKNEIDCSEDEFEEKFSVKLEQISAEELRDMYNDVKNFTPSCLDEISQILDQSGDVAESRRFARPGTLDEVRTVRF
jgi:hypothetical protein